MNIDEHRSGSMQKGSGSPKKRIDKFKMQVKTSEITKLHNIEKQLFLYEVVVWDLALFCRGLIGSFVCFGGFEWHARDLVAVGIGEWIRRARQERQ